MNKTHASTSENLKVAATCIEQNGGRSRLSSAVARPLVRKGWIVKVGRGATFGTGVQVGFYKLTDAGREALKA